MTDDVLTTAAAPSAATPPTKREPYGLLVAALATASFLQWTGAGAVLPLLPVYLSEHATPAALIGAVMASFFATGVAAQYLSGRLGDRIGHRPVLLFGLLGYAVFSAGFLLPLGGWGALGLRAGQGAAAGAAQVACLALVSVAVPPHVRGRAFSAVSGAELAGIAIGPMLGSLFGIDRMALLFMIAAVGALLACIPVLASHAVPVDVEVDRAASADPLPRTGPGGRMIRGVMVAAALGGVLSGAYESSWSLLMHLRGATDVQLGLSWTMFAVPFVVAAPVAGWLADHYDRRWLVVIGMSSGIGFALVYPWLPSVAWLMGLGSLEAVGVALAYPAAQVMLSDAVSEGSVGRAQGTMASVQTAAIAVSTAAGGALFGVSAWLPFTVAAVCGLAMMVVVVWLWRGLSSRAVRGPA
jgi:MFS transporter, DHA1 family, multidrug resistance protein